MQLDSITKQNLRRTTKGAMFVPLGAIVGSHIGLVVMSFVDPAQWINSKNLFDFAYNFSMLLIMVSFVAAYFSAIATFFCLPVLLILLRLKMDHWLLCTLIGFCVPILYFGIDNKGRFIGVFRDLDNFGIITFISAASAGFAAWYGSRPNKKQVTI